MDDFKKIVNDKMSYFDLEYEADNIFKLLEPHYRAIKWIEKQKQNAISYTKFINHIEFTKNTFLELNGYIKNDGYKKLSKRCDNLIIQLDNYRNGKAISSKMKSYFNKTFKGDLPSKTNILSIAAYKLQYQLIIDDWEKMGNNDLDYSKTIIEDIFNVGKFHTSLKYTSISISIPNENDIDIKITLSLYRGKEKRYIYNI